MLAVTTPNLLLQLLRAVHQAGTRSSRDLARELDVSDGLLRQMLVTLAEGGYLRQVTGDCAQQCSSCALQEVCLTSGSTLWTVSEKGRQAIENEP